jgi:hypothetical protein
MQNHLHPSSFLFIYIANISIVIFSSYVSADAIISFFFLDCLHCKTLLSLFSHHISLLKQLFRSSFFLNHIIKPFYLYLFICSPLLNAESLPSFLYIVDLYSQILYRHWFLKFECRNIFFLSIVDLHLKHFYPYLFICSSLFNANSFPSFCSFVYLHCKHFSR